MGWLSLQAAAGLAAQGIRRVEGVSGGREAIVAELSRLGLPASEAVIGAEEDVGGLAGPRLGLSGELDFFAAPRSTLVALGPRLSVRSRLLAQELPAGWAPLGRSVPIAGLAAGTPVLSRRHDRVVRVAAVDDYALDPSGTVFLCGHSTRGALSAIASAPRVLVERIGLLLAMRGDDAGLFVLSVGRRVGTVLAEPVAADPHEAASDRFQRWWYAEQALLHDGDLAGLEPDTTWLWTRSTLVLAAAVEALRGMGAPVEVDAPQVALWDAHAGRAIEGVGGRTAGDALLGHLSSEAVAWLNARGAVLEPGRALSAEALRERLGSLGVSVSEPMLRFEETFGGLCIPSAEGEAFWFGIGLEVEGSVLPRGDLVPMGGFPGGTYWMDPAGRVMTGEGGVEPAIVAGDPWALFEQLARGRAAP
ncbi:uncharacterized protein CMC5_059720 [Chondromyces crocatus]|uniref:Uncharacterized protein n=2 Tax=Chondromyces crocatus TaxID=52 RepID=A0A0K1ELR4_CHOCO|nr:uncharacterized protein CMC5_059720 [Chondromyces crocatus]